MSGTTDVILLVYIRTNHLVKSRSFIFKEFANMSKNHHIKKYRVRQDFGDETQTSIYFIKDELQNSIETIISCIKIK